ncbi:cytochrome c3 family protein [Desulforhopalus singaporensis]|uniref:Cytochrome c7 n=1 Tax=Desulforhopalus singaporensis TaxID=91360 RepID=A0A1H0THG2_9BACT|nr:cytochrome c3 family protein [Desulforhopalus singaporensis]SDP53271.1 Cytochrome c7 [Desulforhopalus singaporensis]
MRNILKRSVKTVFAVVAGSVLIITAGAALGAADGSLSNHPELSQQEMLTPCADCHREATPEIEKQWYASVHGIAMVKCYQCHGTFETFKVTPSREDCATCHADMLDKCPTDKSCWECHVPHMFKERK